MDHGVGKGKMHFHAAAPPAPGHISSDPKSSSPEAISSGDPDGDSLHGVRYASNATDRPSTSSRDEADAVPSRAEGALSPKAQDIAQLGDALMGVVRGRKNDDDDKIPDEAECMELIPRVFAYDNEEGSRAYELTKTRRFSFSEYGQDNSSSEPNPLKRAYQRWYHWYWRKWLFKTLSFPESSTLAMAISAVIISCVIMSSISFVLESMDDLATPFNVRVFSTIEIFAISIFTADYILRLATAPDAFQFAKSTMNLVDLAAVLPYFIFLALGDTNQGSMSRIVRILSLLRVLRLLKLGSRFQNLQVRLWR